MKKSSSARTVQEQAEPSIKIHVRKRQARFKRAHALGSDQGIGEFFLLVDISALKEIVYIPISIASGKKPTGFVYQIEGTKEGTISTTNISCSGDGITQITLGTLLYCKIPAGKTATFRILVEISGKTGTDYKVVANQINYKLSPNDARYKKFVGDISSEILKFK